MIPTIVKYWGLSLFVHTKFWEFRVLYGPEFAIKWTATVQIIVKTAFYETDMLPAPIYVFIFVKILLNPP